MNEIVGIVATFIVGVSIGRLTRIRSLEDEHMKLVLQFEELKYYITMLELEAKREEEKDELWKQ